jgi:hypothetical protein
MLDEGMLSGDLSGKGERWFPQKQGTFASDALGRAAGGGSGILNGILLPRYVQKRERGDFGRQRPVSVVAFLALGV